MATKTIHPVITEVVTDFQNKFGKTIEKEDIDMLDAAYRLGLRKGKDIGEREMQRKIRRIFNRIDLK